MLLRVPICHLTSCPLEDMTSVVGGRAVTRAEGGVIFYQCSAPGAVMLGSPSLVCTHGGWNDTKPECQCKLTHKIPCNTLTNLQRPSQGTRKSCKWVGN